MPSEQEGVTYKFKMLDAKFPIDRRLLDVPDLNVTEQQIAEIARLANYRIMRRICGSYSISPTARKTLHAK